MKSGSSSMSSRQSSILSNLKFFPASSGNDSASGSQWTWKHVALGAMGFLVIGISSYGIYSFLVSSNGNGTSKKGSSKSNSRGLKPSLGDESSTEASITKTGLEAAIDAKMRGNKYFKGREYKKAIECYTKALELSGNLSNESDNIAKTERAAFYHNLAAVYEKLEQPEDVVKQCTSCLEINPKYIKALAKRAKAYKALGKLEEALHDITAASVLEELTNAENLQLSESITKELSEAKAKEKYAMKTKRQNPSKQFIKNYFESFTYDIFETPPKSPEPIPDLNGENEESPTIEPPQITNGGGVESIKGFLKAKQLFEKGEYEDIESACSYEIDKVGAESMYYINALLVRGTFRLLCGAAKLALEDFEIVIKDKRTSGLQKSNALIKRGSMNMQNQDTLKAMSDFEEAVNVVDNSVDAHHHRGQLFLLVDDMDRCIEEFTKCVKLAPTFDQPAVQLCYAEYKIASTNRDIVKVNEAIEKFKQVLKKFPKSSDGYAMYAQALADSGQASEALATFDKAVSLCPENAANYVHKGMLLLQLKGDYNSAVDLIKEGLQKDPRSDFAHEMLGTIEIKRGDYSAAAKAFEKAIDNARFEIELERLYFLYISSLAWKKVKENYGVDVSSVLAKTMSPYAY